MEQKEKIQKKSGKKRKWIKRVLIAVVIVALLVLVLRGCFGGGGSGAAAGTYLSAAVSSQEMTVYVSGTGTVAPHRAQKVTPTVQGEILEAPIEVGQQVSKGDVLFRIDPSDFETSVRQAELALQQAQVSYNQLLNNQADNDKNRTIKASESGVVAKLYVEQGDLVAAGAPIADILDRDNMKLTVPFHSADAAGFYKGQTASVTVDGTMEVLTGTVDSIGAVDSVGAGGTLIREVTIVVPNPGALSHGTAGAASVNGMSCSAGGTFAYAAQAQVVARAAGEVEILSVEEGDRVTEDQAMGMIDATDLNSQVESARLSVENAQLSLDRVLDQWEDHTITADIDGTVVEKNFEAGDKLDASATNYPAVIYDLSELSFVMTIDELDISAVQVGQTVEITADALDGQSFTGVVDSVSINGTTINGKTTYPVTVVVDGAPAQLYPGMNVSAKIIVEEVGSALCIPVDYVSRGNVVLVALPGCLDEAGTVIDLTKMEERQVTLGSSNDEYIQILDGLEEGDVVLRENLASNIMAMMMGV